MKKIIIYFILLLLITSCDLWEKGEKFVPEDNPVVCFNEVTEACGMTDYLIPMPSSYMAGGLPEGLTVNIDPTTPFVVKFGAPVDPDSITEKSVIVMEGTDILPFEDYKVTLAGDNSLMLISHSSGSWNPYSTYVVILLNGLQSEDKLIFGKSKAWFLAISEFQLVDSEGHSTISALDDASANRLQALRDALAPTLDRLTEYLKISRFDILLLWSYKFRNPVACFKESISGCEDDIIPMPSDLMAQALPANTHLNVSTKTNFTLKFSDPLDISTVKENIVILKQSGVNVSLLAPEDFEVTLDKTSDSKIVITPTSKKWDSESRFLVVVKNGVKTTRGDFVTNPGAAFFAKQEESLFEREDNGDLKYQKDDKDEFILDKNGNKIPILKAAYLPIFKKDLDTPMALEMLRLGYKDSLDGLKLLASIERKDIVMFWSVTFGKDFLIPCFNSPTFEGCEDAPLAPLPSDFIMKYEADGTHHLDLPISEDDDDMTKMMLGGLNTLDGWSTSRPFTLEVSDDLDSTTIKTDLRDMVNNPANLMVLKLITDETGAITGAEPTFVTTSFNEDWNKLFISPVLKKWDESSTYLIVMKNDIKGKNGEELVKSIPFSFMSEEEPLIKTVKDEDGNDKIVSKYAALDDETAQKLEMGRLQFSAAYASLAAFGITRADVAMMWTVTTQTVTSDMKMITMGIKANMGIPKVMNFDRVINHSEIETFYSKNLSGYWMSGGDYSFEHVSKIAIGSFKAPWMLTEMNVFDPNKLAGNLVAGDFKDIPIMVAFPEEAEEITADSNIIIFQHGINDAKEEVLPILDMLTERGYIVISIDLPMHGARSVCNTDLIDNFSSRRELPDGLVDCSGEGFLGLNVFATRDLIRQAVIEQVILVQVLKGVDFSSLDSSIKFSTINPNNIKYWGFSLGTIIGNIFITVDDSIKAAVLNVGGGVFTDILMDTKETISGGLFAALSSMGLEKGTKELDDFLYLAQTILDPADPINYTRDFPILLQKSIDDPVIPNRTTDALSVTLGLVNPLTGQVSPNFKSYQMDDYDPYRLFWHSFTMIAKSPSVNAAARLDIINFFNNN